jgi:hypothetical protein
MKTANLVRWGALAALASGALWIAGGLLHLAYPQDSPGMLGYYLDYLGTAIFSAAYLGVLGGLAGLHARQMDSYGRLGRAGFLAAFVGAALAFVGQATSGIFPQNDTLGWLFSDPGFGFQTGILLTSAGLVLLGIATLVRVRPRSPGDLLGTRGVRGLRGGRPYLVGARTRARVEKERGDG